MRIGCLQFDPQVGEVEANLTKADVILDNAVFDKLDLLVLPELAFSGYNFQSLDHISPFLEEQRAGVSSLWARSTALKHDCTVVVGYPEKVAPAPHESTGNEIYNSAIVYDGEGDVIGNHRKTHLYYTDETWASEGPGFFRGNLAGLGVATLGICMDINPYKFEAPWSDFEFARHAVTAGARLVILSMAWLTNDDRDVFNATPSKPDPDTLIYWVSRLEPIVRLDSDREVIVVFGNRCGTEGDATYAGTSAVIGIQSGRVRVYGILGRGSKDLLVVDTDDAPLAELKLSHDRTVQVDVNAADDQADQDNQDGTEGHEEASPASSRASKGDKNAVAMPSQPPEKTDKFKANVSESAAQRRDSKSQSRRPRFPDDDQYMLQRYLESDYPDSKVSPAPVSLENSARHLQHTNAMAKSSFPRRLPSFTEEKGRALRTDAGQRDVHKALRISSAFEDADGMSVRSDVSVWNNQPGRVPNIISRMTEMSGAQHQAVKQRKLW